MARDVDKRNFDYRVPGSDALAGAVEPFLRSFGDTGAVGESTRREFDPFTGSLRRIEIEGGAGAKPLAEYALEIATTVSRSSPVVGFASEAFGEEPKLAEFAMPLAIGKTSVATDVAHLPQYYKGIRIFLVSRTVQVREGRTIVLGNSVDAFENAEAELHLSAEEAVHVAAEYLAPGDDEPADSGWGEMQVAPLDLDEFAPRIMAVFDEPMMPTIMESKPFEGPIKASLTYFYQGPVMRLAWSISLLFPEGAADYSVVVAAGERDPGEILFVRNRACDLAGNCQLHTHNPNETAAKPTSMPLSAADFPASLRAVAPRDDWLETGETFGNNVSVVDQTGKRLAGTVRSATVDFSPAGLIEQATAQTFFFCNIMHNFFEALGFDEAAGNFQARNYSSAQGAGDAVEATVYDTSFSGVATMQTPADGISPIMRMGRYSATNNHSGMDSDVVFHEFVHGVSNRLVGGRMDSNALQDPQSRSMGEGWSDYFALSYHNALRTTEKVVTGDYLTGRAGGIRSAPYDDHYPYSFGDLPNLSGVHQRGEVWCAALMMMTRKAKANLADAIAAQAICWQIVVDGLKLSPPNPSFLDARDAILDALDDLTRAAMITAVTHAGIRRAAWESFAHFGMGVDAVSPGAQMFGIRAGNALPTDL